MAALQTGTSSVDVNKMLIGVTLKRVPQDALVAKSAVGEKLSLPGLGFFDNDRGNNLLRALLFECDCNTDELDSVRKEWMSKIKDAAERLRPRTEELLQ